MQRTLTKLGLSILIIAAMLMIGSSTAVAQCPPDYPIDCGNGFCCPSTHPYCGNILIFLCFSQPCPLSQMLGEDSEQTNLLRDFRDEILLNSADGETLVGQYYNVSDELASIIMDNNGIKAAALKVILHSIKPPTNSYDYKYPFKKVGPGIVRPHLFICQPHNQNTQSPSEKRSESNSIGAASGRKPLYYSALDDSPVLAIKRTPPTPPRPPIGGFSPPRSSHRSPGGSSTRSAAIWKPP